jgi:hypothetical protein
VPGFFVSCDGKIENSRIIFTTTTGIKRMTLVTGLTLATLLATSTHFSAQGREVNVSDAGGSGAQAITAQIWVDNWFALSVNGSPLLEDSTPYNTERSFNAEQVTFRADLPLTVAFEFRDFMENDTGLEYIGSGRQQMGDGGAIAQFFDTASGAVIGVSDADWKCLVVHHAPVSTSCESASSPVVGQGDCASQITSAPANWTAPGFDDSSWASATEHSERAVSPKDGYDQISWNSKAELIWGTDLERDNIVLCRATFQ